MKKIKINNVFRDLSRSGRVILACEETGRITQYDIIKISEKVRLPVLDVERDSRYNEVNIIIDGNEWPNEINFNLIGKELDVSS